MRKWVLRALALVVLLMTLWLGVGALVADHEADRVRRAWAERVLPMDEFARQYPRAPANAAALAIESRAQALGIDLRASFPSPSTGGQPGALDSLPDSLLLEYISSQLSRADDAGIEHPPELAAFLERYASPLESLETEILGGPEPVWAKEPPTILSEHPIPWHLRKLVSLLRLDALDKGRKGNVAAADRALQACWKLNSAHRNHPLVIGQLIAIAIDSDILRALRRLTPPSEAWRARVTAHDYRRSVLASFQGEVLFTSAQIQRSRVDNARAGLWCRLEGALKVPYSRMCLANYSDLMRSAILDLRATKDACAVDEDSLVKGLRVPRWNVVAWDLPSLLSAAYASAAGIAIDQEVTSRILETRSAPAEVPWLKEGGFRSSVCESLVWTVDPRPSREYGPDGAVTLSPSRPLPRPLGNLTVRRSR
jgi:hypothetical protein